MSRQPLQLFSHFRGDIAAECFVVNWVVHVGKHEILPDKDPQLVTDPIKGIGLIDHRTADTQHIDTRIACERQIISQLLFAAAK